MKLTLLATGWSSLAEARWFLVGANGDEAYLVTEETGRLGLHEWEVRIYGAGSDFSSEPTLKDQRREDIIDFCKRQNHVEFPIHIDWNDKKKATELYWKYRGY